MAKQAEQQLFLKVWLDWQEQLSMLNYEQTGRVITGLLRYCVGENYSQIIGDDMAVKIAFAGLLVQVKRDREKYIRDVTNGKTGGRGNTTKPPV